MDITRLNALTAAYTHDAKRVALLGDLLAELPGDLRALLAELSAAHGELAAVTGESALIARMLPIPPVATGDEPEALVAGLVGRARDMTPEQVRALLTIGDEAEALLLLVRDLLAIKGSFYGTDAPEFAKALNRLAAVVARIDERRS